MLSLLLTLALSQTPQHRLFLQPNLPRFGGPQAFASAFGPSGAGTFGACSTTTPTTSDGKPFITTRGTNGGCLKQGLKLTGLVPGDFISLGPNIARVMPNYEGQLGILVENSITNLVSFSEEFDNVNWILYHDAGAGIPTVTPNQALGLDGTMTADRIDFPATAGSQSSLIYQGVCQAGQFCSVGFFVQGVPGVSDSGTIDVCAGNAGVNTCMPCAFVSSSIAYCKRVGIAGNVGSVFIGNATFYNGGTPRPAQSLFVWGAHASVNPYVPMYAKTTSSNVSILNDLVQVDLGADAPTSMEFSISISSSGYSDTTGIFQYSAYFASNSSFFAEKNPRGIWSYSNDAPPTGQRCIAGPDSGVFTLTQSVALSSTLMKKSTSCWAEGGSLYGSYVGQMMPPTVMNVGTAQPARYFNIGNSGGQNVYTRPGLYTDMCFDKNPTLCRPT